MGRSSQYCYSEAELQALLRDRQQSLGPTQTSGSPAIQRFEGALHCARPRAWAAALLSAPAQRLNSHAAPEGRVSGEALW